MPLASYPRKKGEKLAPLSERLARLGLNKDWDYVLHLPIRYEDETSLTPIGRLEPGQTQQCEGSVVRSERIRRPSGEQLQAIVADGSGTRLALGGHGAGRNIQMEIGQLIAGF